MLTQAVTNAKPAVPGRLMNAGIWVLQIAAAGLFLMAGSGKLAGDEKMVAVFGAIGIGQWFRVLTGVLEVIGAIGLLIPRFSGLAALLLSAVMVGAVITHAFVIGGSPLMAIVLLIVTGIIAWVRRTEKGVI